MSYFSRAMATTSKALFSMELAAMNIQDALAKASLASGGKLVVLSSFDSFLSESGRPSSWLLNKAMIQLLSFLTRHHSHFLVSIFPFLSLITDGGSVLERTDKSLTKKRLVLTLLRAQVENLLGLKFSCLNHKPY